MALNAQYAKVDQRNPYGPSPDIMRSKRKQLPSQNIHYAHHDSVLPSKDLVKLYESYQNRQRQQIIQATSSPNNQSPDRSMQSAHFASEYKSTFQQEQERLKYITPGEFAGKKTFKDPLVNEVADTSQWQNTNQMTTLGAGQNEYQSKNLMEDLEYVRAQANNSTIAGNSSNALNQSQVMQRQGIQRGQDESGNSSVIRNGNAYSSKLRNQSLGKTIITGDKEPRINMQSSLKLSNARQHQIYTQLDQSDYNLDTGAVSTLLQDNRNSSIDYSPIKKAEEFDNYKMNTISEPNIIRKSLNSNYHAPQEYSQLSIKNTEIELPQIQGQHGRSSSLVNNAYINPTTMKPMIQTPLQSYQGNAPSQNRHSSQIRNSAANQSYQQINNSPLQDSDRLRNLDKAKGARILSEQERYLMRLRTSIERQQQLFQNHAKSTLLPSQQQKSIYRYDGPQQVSQNYSIPQKVGNQSMIVNNENKSAFARNNLL
eukprot:403339556